MFHRHHVQGCTYSRVLGPRARFLGGACLSAAVKQDLSDKELRGTEVEPKPISSPPPLKTAREVFPPAAHPVRFIEGVMCRVNDDNHFQLPRMFNPGCSIGCKPANDGRPFLQVLKMWRIRPLLKRLPRSVTSGTWLVAGWVLAALGWSSEP